MIDPSLSRPDDQRTHIGTTGQAARVLRDRQQIARESVGRAVGLPTVAAPRRLVSVYDGGSMPSQPDHIFLTHPVELIGNEAEGSSASPDVDTAATIPVVVLRKPPQVGDLLVATSVGGRWVAELGGGGQSRVCIRICGTISLEGAVVTLFSGQQVVATATAGADGCCQFPVTGTFNVQVFWNGAVRFNATRTLSAAFPTTIMIATGTELICCGNLVIPAVLTLTDAAGTISLIYDPNWYFPIWTGGHSVQRRSSTVSMPTGLCEVADPTEGPVRVCYQMSCLSAKDPAITIQRSWSWVFQQGTLTPIWFQDNTGFAPGQLCVTAPPPLCGSPQTDAGTFSANPTTETPFTITGTPAPGPGNATSDPIGGSIAISA